MNLVRKILSPTSWIAENIIKRILDWIPFSGWKTYSGVLISLVAVVAGVLGLPEDHQITEYIKNVLLTFGNDPLLDTGQVTVIIGVIHKLLKLIYGSKKK